MSAVAEAGAPGATDWERLERAAERTSAALLHWRGRAEEAEAEVVRLRGALEGITRPGDSAPGPADSSEEAGRLRAENALLRSRVAEARRRIGSLLARLDAVEGKG